MPVLHPGQTSTKADSFPAGLFGYQVAGVDEGGYFIDLEELDYRIVDADDVEVLPWTAVDVDRESVTTDAVLGFTQGLYAPDVAVPGPAISFGTWRIDWRFRVEIGDPQLTGVTYFRVVDPTHPIVAAYAQVQDMYDEGVPQAMFDPARVARALQLGTELFEKYTGRNFEPRLLTVDVDGEGGPIKQLDMAIIGLTDVGFTFTTFSPADLPIEEGDLRIYNRHIRNQLLEPDDREDPRVEFLRIENYRYPRQTLLGDTDLLSSAVGFPASQQNIKLAGAFGYTDPDGTPFGRTPELVKEAVIRIAMRKVQPLWMATGGGASMGVAGPIAMEKTFDQQVKYSEGGTQSGSGAYLGYFTGDPEIDQIISAYRLPPRLRSTGP